MNKYTTDIITFNRGDLIDGSDAVVEGLHPEKEYIFMENGPIQEENEEEIKTEINQND